MIDVASLEAGAVKRRPNRLGAEPPGPVEIEPVLVGKAVVAPEPFGLDAEMALVDKGALEHGQVLVDVGDLVAEMFAGEVSRHVLRHQVGGDGSANRKNTRHDGLFGPPALRSSEGYLSLPSCIALRHTSPCAHTGKCLT